MQPSVVITGSGLFTPPHSISNEELAASLAVEVTRWNEENQAGIDGGELQARALPDAEFIEQASGIKRRFVMEKSGILDPERLRRHLHLRGEADTGVRVLGGVVVRTRGWAWSMEPWGRWWGGGGIKRRGDARGGGGGELGSPIRAAIRRA